MTSMLIIRIQHRSSIRFSKTTGACNKHKAVFRIQLPVHNRKQPGFVNIDIVQNILETFSTNIQVGTYIHMVSSLLLP